MFKELHLTARIICSFLAVMAFTWATGLGYSMMSVGVGTVIFVNSFVFQYFVLHFALKKIATTPRDRWLFLAWWFFFCMTGLTGAVLMIPQFQNIALYASVEDFARKSSLWGTVFIAFSAAFVALVCTQRTFSRHGLLADK